MRWQLSGRDRPTGPTPWILPVLAAVWGGGLAFGFARREGFWGDFLAWWYGAQVWLSGGNPYLSPPSGAPYYIPEPLFYPFPALLLSLPVTPLPYLVAITLFFALGAAILGYGIAREAPHLWPLFLSFPFLMAAELGHWAPYLAVAVLIPWLGFFLTTKPNIALAVLARRPSVPLIAGMAVLGVISLAVWPGWIGAWLANVRGSTPHPVPLLSWMGAPLALAVLRWRQPEARLLLAMSLLPQTASFADQLVLQTVARDRRQSMFLALASFLGGIAWILRLREPTETPAVLIGVPYVTAALYWPALVLVLLRRPAKETI